MIRFFEPAPARGALIFALKHRRFARSCGSCPPALSAPKTPIQIGVPSFCRLRELFQNKNLRPLEVLASPPLMVTKKRILFGLDNFRKFSLRSRIYCNLHFWLRRNGFRSVLGWVIDRRGRAALAAGFKEKVPLGNYLLANVRIFNIFDAPQRIFWHSLLYLLNLENDLKALVVHFQRPIHNFPAHFPVQQTD